MQKKAAWVFAVVFVLLGIGGFVPGVTTNGELLGIFHVDSVHNVIHLLTGLVAALAAWHSAKSVKLFFQVFGVVYALVAVIGLVQGDTVLGLFGVNMADNILHVVVAAAALWFGFAPSQNGGSGGMMDKMKSKMGAAQMGGASQMPGNTGGDSNQPPMGQQ